MIITVLLLFMLTNVLTDRRASIAAAHAQRSSDAMCRPLYYLKMSAKAVVGRALRETGAALKQASGAEVCLRGVLMMAVARRSGISCMAICRRNGGMYVWPRHKKCAVPMCRFDSFGSLSSALDQEGLHSYPLHLKSFSCMAHAMCCIFAVGLH